MNAIKLFTILLVQVMAYACSKVDQTAEAEKLDGKGITTCLSYKEAPKFKVILTDSNGAKDITLQIFNKKVELKSIEIIGNPSESTEVLDNFYTNFCNKKVLVVVIRQWMNTSIDYGGLYYNALINVEDGSLLKVFTESEVKDKETNEIISNG